MKTSAELLKEMASQDKALDPDYRARLIAYIDEVANEVEGDERLQSKTKAAPSIGGRRQG